MKKYLLLTALLVGIGLVFQADSGEAVVLRGDIGENPRVVNRTLRVAYREVCTIRVAGKDLPRAKCKIEPVYRGEPLRVTHQRDLLW